MAGVRLQGGFTDLVDVCIRFTADVVLWAAPRPHPASCQAGARRDRPRRGSSFMVLPSFDEMLSAPSPHRGVRARGHPAPSPASTSPPAALPSRAAGRPARSRCGRDRERMRISQYLRGRVVLVTGRRRCHRFPALSRDRRPSVLAGFVMTDRDDSLLHGVQLSVDGRGLLDSPGHRAGRPSPRRLRALTSWRRVVPTSWFHAAAVKHLTLAERFPAETCLANVAATAELLDACVSAGVERLRQHLDRQGHRPGPASWVTASGSPRG